MDKTLKHKTKLHIEKNYPQNFLRNFIPCPKKTYQFVFLNRRRDDIMGNCRPSYRKLLFY